MNLDTYLDVNLGREGLAELRSMQIDTQIADATGIHISFTSTNVTKPMYQAVYDHFRADSSHYTFYDAMHDMGTIYGQYEHTANGQSYHDYYVNEYHRLSGH